MRELLRHRDFRLLLGGQTLSMFGDWTLLLVFGIWAKNLTGSNAVAGLTVLAMAAPGLLGPLAGVVVDRLPRRAVMIALNVAGAVAVSTLWFVQDRDQLWLLFVVAAWYGISSVMFNAAMSGLVQAMLPPDQIGPANGLLATVRQALRLVGPLIGAGLFTTVGGHWVAALDAATFLLSSVALLLLRHREVVGERTPVPFWTELSAGLLHLWTTPTLRATALTTVVFSSAIGAVEPTVYALVDGLRRALTSSGCWSACRAPGPSSAACASAPPSGASRNPRSSSSVWSSWPPASVSARSRPCRLGWPGSR